MNKLSARQMLQRYTLILILATTGPLFANDNIAVVDNLGDTLVFNPTVEFRKMILTVTGPCGFDYRQAVTSGQLLFTPDATAIDGSYTYNLFQEATVDPAILEILMQARA